jgi:hypothetical protein
VPQLQSGRRGDCELLFEFDAPASETDNCCRVFYINLPICSLALLGLYCFLKFPPPRTSWRTLFAKIDWIGLGILTGSLGAVLFGITSGDVLFPWGSAKIIAPLVVGSLGLVVFVLYEHKIASNPVVPLRIFATQTAASGYYITFVQALILWAIAYYLILYVSHQII